MPGDMAVAVFSLVMILLIGLAVWWGLSRAFPETEEKPKTIAVKHDSLAPTYTHDGEVIRWYVLVDPDTNIEYLVNDQGGCCPRLNRNGSVMGVTDG